MTTGLTSGGGRAAIRWCPFALLCALWFARLALAEFVPAVLSTSGSLSLAAVGACGIYFALAWARREVAPSARRLGRWALSGTLLICGPHLAMLLRTRDVTGSDLLLAGSLVTVVVAVSVAAQTENGLSSQVVFAGLGAAAGLMLVLPEPRIHTVLGASVLVLFPMTTGVGASMFSATDQRPLTWSVASSCGGGAVTFLIFSFAPGQHSFRASWLAVVLDAVTILCTLLAVRQIGPVRYSAAFVIVPCAALLYGFFLLRPELTLRAASGLLLLVASAVALMLFRSKPSPDSALHLLR